MFDLNSLPVEYVSWKLRLVPWVVIAWASLPGFLFITSKSEKKTKLFFSWISSLVEGAAVAYVADMLKVPAIFVKAVTDIVDGEKPTAEEFLQNLAMVTATLGQSLAQIIDFISGKCLSELWTNDTLLVYEETNGKLIEGTHDYLSWLFLLKVWGYISDDLSFNDIHLLSMISFKTESVTLYLCSTESQQ